MDHEKHADEFHIWSVVGDRYISTIYRQSSACVNNPPWYYETIIFKRTAESCRAGVLHMLGTVDIRKARKVHWQITESLLSKPKPKEK